VYDNFLFLISFYYIFNAKLQKKEAGQQKMN